jgi:hypothetical protein
MKNVASTIKLSQQLELLIDDENDRLLIFEKLKTKQPYKVIAEMRKYKLDKQYLEKSTFMKMFLSNQLMALKLLTRENLYNSHLQELHAFLIKSGLTIEDFYDLHRKTKKLFLNILITF